MAKHRTQLNSGFLSQCWLVYCAFEIISIGSNLLTFSEMSGFIAVMFPLKVVPQGDAVSSADQCCSC